MFVTWSYNLALQHFSNKMSSEMHFSHLSMQFRGGICFEMLITYKIIVLLHIFQSTFLR